MIRKQLHDVLQRRLQTSMAVGMEMLRDAERYQYLKAEAARLTGLLREEVVWEILLTGPADATFDEMVDAAMHKDAETSQ